jgi:hypothetical protein
MTAIIVNDKGEVFTHWASACSISVSGYETYYSVPNFAKTQTLFIRDNDFTPYSLHKSRRRHYTINKPYLFNSVESAEKARSRMWGQRTAVVY